MVVVVDAVGSPLIVVVAGDYTKIDVCDVLAEGKLQIGKAAQSLRGGKGECVLGPEDACALSLVVPAGGQEIDGDLGAPLGLGGGGVLGVQLAEGIEDGVLGHQCELHDAEDDLDGQMRQLVKGLVQGRQAQASTPTRLGGGGSGLEAGMRGDSIAPGNSVLAQQALQARVLILELAVLGSQRGVVAHLSLLLMVATVPREDGRHVCLYPFLKRWTS